MQASCYLDQRYDPTLSCSIHLFGGRLWCLHCQKLGCKLALYNHGDWFGQPTNQIKIIKLLGRYDIGLVYSFHHGHQQLSEFKKMAEEMEPYLVAVNLNGMKKGGPQIYPLGQGDDEKEMIDIIVASGYKGPFGILGIKKMPMSN